MPSIWVFVCLFERAHKVEHEEPGDKVNVRRL